MLNVLQADYEICPSFQRYPADKAYYIAKELLMTERTYKKDLEVITVVSIATIKPPQNQFKSKQLCLFIN